MTTNPLSQKQIANVKAQILIMRYGTNHYLKGLPLSRRRILGKSCSANAKRKKNLIVLKSNRQKI